MTVFLLTGREFWDSSVFPLERKNTSRVLPRRCPLLWQVETSDADVIKKTKGTLNKLTPERFDKLLAQ